MLHSFLDSSETIGFCTLIERTNSRLFTRRLDVTSESFSDETDWFRVFIPASESAEFNQLDGILRSLPNGPSPDTYGSYPILIEIPSANVLEWGVQRQAR